MTDPNLTAYTATARVQHHCQGSHGYNSRLILPGEDYVVLTVFPRHDAARCHFPETRRVCLPCWGLAPLPLRRKSRKLTLTGAAS